jgi:hypothetical protein
MRKEYEMTDQQFERLLDACKPVLVIFVSGGQSMFRSSQENANDAWAALGRELKFKPMTVHPVYGKGQRFFTAEPQEDGDE